MRPWKHDDNEPIAAIVCIGSVILTLSRHRSVSSVRLVFLGALLLPGPTLLRARANLPDVPEANPARPTVSTPATLTPVSYLQFEDGGLYAPDSSEVAKRPGINQVSKLTLDQRVELLTLFEPFTHSTGAEVSGNRPGEVFAGGQYGLTVSALECSRTRRLIHGDVSNAKPDRLRESWRTVDPPRDAHPVSHAPQRKYDFRDCEWSRYATLLLARRSRAPEC
jgi:hypothetical protein